MIVSGRQIAQALVMAFALAGLVRGLEPAAADAQDTLADSAQLRRDRRLQTLLAAGREKIQQGDVLNAVGLLQQVLDSEEDAFTPSGESYVSVQGEANRLLASLPRASLELYERQFGAEAWEAWRKAQSAADVAQMVEVSARYHNTACGLEALRVLASRHFDQGRFALAAAGFRLVADHPLCDRRMRAAALARVVLCWQRLGHADRAAAWVSEHREEFSDLELAIAGQPTDVAGWLALFTNPPSAEESSVLEGHGPADARATEAPSLTPVWRHETAPAEEIAELVEAGITDLQDYGATRLDSFVPVSVGDVVLVRTMQGISAINTRSGEVVWEKLLQSGARELAENLKRLENQAFRELMSEMLVAQLQADSISGQIAAGDDRVFVVCDAGPVDWDSLAERQFRGRRRFQGSDPPEANALCAIDVKSGKELWTTGQNSGLDGAFFLGAPLPAGDFLYGMGRKEGEVRLFCLRAADGGVDWSLSLAEGVGSATGMERYLAAPPHATEDGVLVCPTSAGAVVAVDPFSRRLLWGARFERVDRPKPEGLPRGRRWTDVQAQAWWKGWRFPAVASGADRVVVASGETQTLHALELSTGREVWRGEHRQGLYVAGVDGSRVIVVEKHAVRALDLQTGTEQWATPVDVPCGKGVFTKSEYLLPLEGGGLAAIRLDDGALRTIRRDQRLGNLVATPGRVVSQTYREIAVLAPLSESRAVHTQRFAQNSHDLAAILDLAGVEQESGNYRAAADLLKSIAAEDPEARRRLRSVLFDELAANPAQIEAIADEIEPLLETPEDRVQFHRLAAAAHRGLGENSAAVEEYMKLVDVAAAHRVPGSGQEGASAGDAFVYARVSDGGPSRLVLNERWVQGEVADLLAGADSRSAERIAAMIEQRQGAALENSDPLALLRFADTFGELPWGHRAWLELSGRIKNGAAAPRIRLALLALADAHEPQTAATALTRLAELLSSRSEYRNAAACYRRLLNHWPEAVVDGVAVRDFVAARTQSEPYRLEVEAGPSDPWTAGAPRIANEEPRPIEGELLAIPVEAAAGSLFDRLGVYLARIEGRTGTEWQIWFQGDGQRGFWRLELPQTSDSFRALAPLNAGWGLGHVLVLKVGNELFGIAPLDENGETNARILWRIDTLADVAFGPGTMPLRMIRRPPGFGLFDFFAVDRYGYPLGRVGPVTPRCACYLHKGLLVAIDPLTGERLWQRSDVSAEARCAGDGEVVLLYAPDSKEVEVLRAIDGKTIGVRTLDVFPREFLMVFGRNALVAAARKAGEAVTLRSLDLAEGSTAWSRDFAPGTMPFRIDKELVGVLDPAGSIYLVRLGSGAVLAETGGLAVPGKVTGVYASVDEQRIFVAVSGPFAELANMRANEQRYDFRGAFVNGPMYAFDRRTGALLWKADLTDALFPLDQTREAPLLVLDYAHTAKDGEGNERVLDVLECLDKHSGRTLFREEAPASRRGMSWRLETDVEQKQVTLRTPTKAVRLEY